MTQQEQKIFIKSLEGKKYRLLYLTYLYTGARRSELVLGDSFKVNLYNNTIHIKGTKTINSIRIVPLFNTLKNELIYFQNYSEYFNSFRPDRVTKLLRKHCDEIGLYDICVHSLRTTFSTRCLESGISPKTIQTWLGHSRLDITMNTYIDGRIFNDIENYFNLSEIEKFNKHW